MSGVEPPPQVHLETRFGQLATAVEMELWQEAYRTVEDVHALTLLMKKPPKPSSMASYHAQLAQVDGGGGGRRRESTARGAREQPENTPRIGLLGGGQRPLPRLLAHALVRHRKVAQGGASRGGADGA